MRNISQISLLMEDWRKFLNKSESNPPSPYDEGWSPWDDLSKFDLSVTDIRSETLPHYIRKWTSNFIKTYMSYWYAEKDEINSPKIKAYNIIFTGRPGDETDFFKEPDDEKIKEQEDLVLGRVKELLGESDYVKFLELRNVAIKRYLRDEENYYNRLEKDLLDNPNKNDSSDISRSLNRTKKQDMIDNTGFKWQAKWMAPFWKSNPRRDPVYIEKVASGLGFSKDEMEKHVYGRRDELNDLLCLDQIDKEIKRQEEKEEQVKREIEDRRKQKEEELRKLELEDKESSEEKLANFKLTEETKKTLKDHFDFSSFDVLSVGLNKENEKNLNALVRCKDSKQWAMIFQDVKGQAINDFGSDEYLDSAKDYFKKLTIDNDSVLEDPYSVNPNQASSKELSLKSIYNF